MTEPGEIDPAELAALHQGPLRDYVARRGDLAKRLRAAGDRDAAARVARLPRPPVTAWAVNRVVADAPDLILDLLAAVRAAVAAQSGGDPDATRETAARVRELVEAGVAVAGAALADGGHAAPEATLRRIRSTLGAAAVGEPAVRAALWRGVLAGDVDPPGFGVPPQLDADLPGLAVLLEGRAPSPSPAEGERPAPRRATGPSAPPRLVVLPGVTLRAAERELADLQRVEARASDAAVRLREAATRLQSDAERAALDAEAAEVAAARARTEVVAAEERLSRLAEGDVGDRPSRRRDRRH